MLSDHFNTTISVSRYTQVSDGKGGWTETWANVSGLTSIAARKMRLSANESLKYNRNLSEVIDKFLIESGSVLVKDRIVESSYTYEVIEEPFTHTGIMTSYVSIIAKRVSS